MKTSQQQLAQCLAASIRNQAYQIDEAFNLEPVIAEAKAHDVEGLVYKVLKSQTDLSAYKQEIIFKSLMQSQYMGQSMKTLNYLKESGIQVVLLKGAVLKNYYAQADLRTMGDVDVLVHEHDLELVHQLLTSLGYVKRPLTNGKHHVYDGEGFHLEVHWSLVNASRQTGFKDFETTLWQHLKTDHGFLRLSDEDFLVHLLLHAAGHFKSSGFGIRQLCDITLWMEAHPELDFTYIWRRLTELKLVIFSTYVLAACRELLQLEIDDVQVNQAQLFSFIEAIFSSGVHGHREKGNQFGHYFAYVDHKQSNGRIFLQTVFPSIRDLPKRYTYAHRYHWLLPIAWVDRFFRVLFHQRFSFSEKLYILVKTPSIAKQKAKLLQSLDLVE
ncbi:nucleotidyltransferase domain-containing protein [Turicibacter sanguinis]|uniref:nucleotidyltransferase domain-containing protein n=1 Tax=Turicibacter sanguinis TaxID=154288 RepID=UPI0032EB7AEE